ncbi:CASP-like protein 1F1 [Tanacetum coccineum]
MDTENKNVAVLEGRPIPSPITHLSFMASQIWLRIVAAATSITAAILIFKSHESKVLFGTDVDARYSYSPAFKSRVVDEDDL